MADFPSFEQFYRAVHERDPFPWQCRLAAMVRESGWPSDIGVPTGLGKTACIDIAVWSLAAQGLLPADERTLPRRIWYVVDRRLLVDAASTHAHRLSVLMLDPPSGPVEGVAHGLRALGATRVDRPLHVWRLRGGANPSDGPGGRAGDPAQPAVICATVAMFGSRLLFRGFGSSQSMWPIDAAHAGTDSLVLLDEAHLARPLQQLVGLVRECDANRTGILRYAGRHVGSAGPRGLLPGGRTYPQLVNLTATGNAGAFELGAEDLANPVVIQRLHAAKPTRLVATSQAELAATLAAELQNELAGRESGSSAVVFVNSPATARAVTQALHRQTGQIDLVVLTGQLRDPDADALRSRLLDPQAGAAAGTSPTRAKPLVVIATQTLEVGADLDFDICVSETAGARALVQRWGRLNRLGLRHGASGVLVHPTDGGGGLYGDEPAQLWGRLLAAGQPLDLGPAVIAEILGPPQDRPERVGQLLPCHLWEFAKTTNPPPGAAPPEVFFDALDEQDRRVTLLWRAVVPAPGNPLVPAPSDRESVEVPIGDARDFLAERGQGQVMSDDGVTVVELNPSQLRPGSTVVLPASRGGYGQGGWDPTVTDTVRDLSPSLRATLHLTPAALHNLLEAPPSSEVEQMLADLMFDPDEGPDPAIDQNVAERLGDVLHDGGPQRQLMGAVRFRIERFGEDLMPLLRWDLQRPAPAPRVDALDELSNSPRVSLAEHLASVGELAGRIATAVGLPPDIAQAVSDAGCLHDLGKADARFQRWLGNSGGVAMAKSAMSQGAWRRAAFAAGWPVGGRHELLSVQLIDAYLAAGGSLASPDLVRHLVLTHHGKGRPLCPTTQDGATVRTDVEIAGSPVAAGTDTRAVDWAQPDRFRLLCEEYGYWGLALLEAVVRQADHRVSAATEVI